MVVVLRQPSDKERHCVSQSDFRGMSLALKRRHPMMAEETPARWNGWAQVGRGGNGQACLREVEMKSGKAFGRKQVYQKQRNVAAVFLFTLAALSTTMGCSVKKFAINKLGDSLANSGTTFAADNDPEFVGQAVPFSLKLIEGLLAESPKHKGLLFAAASGFTQYSYAYVQQSSEQVETEDVTKSQALRERARNLYLRARDYGLRGLETKHRGFSLSLRENPKAAVRIAKPADVPLLYWTAVAWGAAIALSKDRPELVAEQPQVEAM